MTNKYQSSTRLKINNEILETVNETRLLGAVTNNDLKWDRNTSDIVNRAYKRIQILRRLKKVQASHNNLKLIPIYCLCQKPI